MKKFILILAIIVLSIPSFGQRETWSVSSQGENDTLAKAPSGIINRSWQGANVFITITIWDPEALDGNFYIGGHSRYVTRAIKDKFDEDKPDWGFYGTADDGTDISPIVADTTVAGWVYNADSTAFNFRTAINNFAYPEPAFMYYKNNTASTNYSITFEMAQDR